MQSIVLSTRCTRKLDLESTWQLRDTPTSASRQVRKITGRLQGWQGLLGGQHPSTGAAFILRIQVAHRHGWLAASVEYQRHFPVLFCPISCSLCREPHGVFSSHHPSRSQIPWLLRSPPCLLLTSSPTNQKNLQANHTVVESELWLDGPLWQSNASGF